MLIGIDFHSAEREGTGNCSYFRGLVQALLALDQENEYLLYVTDPRLAYFRRFQSSPRFRLAPLGSRTPFGRLFALGRRARRDAVDVLHVQYVAPPFWAGRLVLSVHDLAFVAHPECFPPSMRAYLKTLVPPSIRRASRVLTVSEFSRRAIVDRFRSAKDKVSVVPLAARDSGRIGNGRRGRRDELGRLGIRGKFILYVGRLDARKNIPALLRAFSWLKAQRSIPHQLVLAGSEDYWPAAMEREWAVNDHRTEIIRTGHVAERTLEALYAEAEAFVYPSLYEGFGLPVIEAMAAGCPVVCSDTSSLPEVVGDAGLLVPPSRPEILAEALGRVLADDRLRAALRRKGRARARRFSWEETARRTLDVYRKAAALSAGGHRG